MGSDWEIYVLGFFARFDLGGIEGCDDMGTADVLPLPRMVEWLKARACDRDVMGNSVVGFRCGE